MRHRPKTTRVRRAWPLALAATLLGGSSAVALDLTQDAIERGRTVYRDSCQTCHSMQYLGLAAQLPAESAKQAFGKPAPDLSLMASARGRGTQGAAYVSNLLTSYEESPRRNAMAPNTAMPDPFPSADPARREKSAQVAAFLYYASDPSFRQRERLGRYAVGYALVLSGLLYLLYREVWKAVPKG